MSAKIQRVGILGGSFDPVHIGHIAIAQLALERLHLDGVYFIPAAHSPLKTSAPKASDAQRLAMVELAIQEREAFKVLDCELQRSGPSYTVDTVHQLLQHWPNHRFYWIIGADQVAQLSEWKEIGTLLKHIDFICFQRPGCVLQLPENFPEAKLHMITGTSFTMSSSEVRQRIAAGCSVADMLDRNVLHYIEHNQLYKI